MPILQIKQQTDANISAHTVIRQPNIEFLAEKKSIVAPQQNN